MSLLETPFLGVTVVSFIVFAAAFTLLTVLVYKGWKTNTMRGYVLIYACLFNMASVWACQIPLNWIQPPNYDPLNPYYFNQSLTLRLTNVLKMMPMSTFLFSLKYFKVVIELVPLQERTRGRFDVLSWFSYLFAFALFCLWLTAEIEGLYDFAFGISIFSFEIIVGFFACLFLLTTLILVKRFCN